MSFSCQCNEAYINAENCRCDECRTLNIDWTKLSNTEKMVKALLLKAQFAAELNDSLD